MVEKDDSTSDPAAPKQNEMRDTEIDESLIESFPASDPPSWTLGTDHQSPLPQTAARKESGKDSVSKDDK